MSKTGRNLARNGKAHPQTIHTNANGNRIEHLLHLNGTLDQNGKVRSEKKLDLSMKKRFEARTPNQKKYIRAILDSDITVCLSCAGSGKTATAIGIAAQALSQGQCERIILVRPAVPCEEDLGFLPGDLQAKMDPYVRPMNDELAEYFTDEQLDYFYSGRRPIIEVVPLAFMKGRTFKKAFVILDEAQDTTYTQLKMILTRTGEASKVIITGDVTQSDLVRQNMRTPLEDVVDKLEGMDGFSIVRLTPDDIQRHPKVAQILERI